VFYFILYYACYCCYSYSCLAQIVVPYWVLQAHNGDNASKPQPGMYSRPNLYMRPSFYQYIMLESPACVWGPASVWGFMIFSKWTWVSRLPHWFSSYGYSERECLGINGTCFERPHDLHLKTLTPARENHPLVSSFHDPPTDSRGKGTANSLYASTSMGNVHASHISQSQQNVISNQTSCFLYSLM